MPWKVTKSFIEDSSWKFDGFDGSSTPVDVQSCDYVEDELGLLVRLFRMYDDDGCLYYEGITDDFETFEPLDDYGTPNAGCTEIRYLNEETKEWETL